MKHPANTVQHKVLSTGISRADICFIQIELAHSQLDLAPEDASLQDVWRKTGVAWESVCSESAFQADGHWQVDTW